MTLDNRFKLFVLRSLTIWQDIFSCIDFGLAIWVIIYCLNHDSSTHFLLRFIEGTAVLVLVRMVLCIFVYLMALLIVAIIGRIQREIMWFRINIRHKEVSLPQILEDQSLSLPTKYVDQKRRHWYDENYDDLFNSIDNIIFIVSIGLGLSLSIWGNFNSPWILSFLMLSGITAVLLNWLVWLVQTFSCMVFLTIGMIQRLVDRSSKF